MVQNEERIKFYVRLAPTIDRTHYVLMIRGAH